jgi:hypothetical protein
MKVKLGIANPHTTLLLGASDGQVTDKTGDPEHLLGFIEIGG